MDCLTCGDSLGDITLEFSPGCTAVIARDGNRFVLPCPLEQGDICFQNLKNVALSSPTTGMPALVWDAETCTVRLDLNECPVVEWASNNGAAAPPDNSACTTCGALAFDTDRGTISHVCVPGVGWLALPALPCTVVEYDGAGESEPPTGACDQCFRLARDAATQTITHVCVEGRWQPLGGGQQFADAQERMCLDGPPASQHFIATDGTAWPVNAIAAAMTTWPGATQTLTASATTLGTGASTYFIDATSGPQVITLPPCGSCKSRHFTLMRVDSNSAANVTVQLVNGAPYSLAVGEHLDVHCTGTGSSWRAGLVRPLGGGGGGAPTGCTEEVTAPNGKVGVRVCKDIFTDSTTVIDAAGNVGPEQVAPAAGFPVWWRQAVINGSTGRGEYWIVLADVNGVNQWHQIA